VSDRCARHAFGLCAENDHGHDGEITPRCKSCLRHLKPAVHRRYLEAQARHG
jgi:hypothetical protein